ncbi:hypothetical protein GOBAR_AA35705 [Gossypium barbadense]|uniref:Uncharacterized protein n=1 Tax=Gossypium barbadense TaxID=3634 RepID=A0A2P5W1P4_GOSBA|nr:hypothetical protein GOBAR_AA35705 [Gossypium barbadense]
MARKIGCFLKKSEKVLMATKRNRGQQLITIQMKKWSRDLLHLKVGAGAKQICAHATQRGTFDMEIEYTWSTAELHAGDNTFTTKTTFVTNVRICDEYENAWIDVMIGQLSRNALHARFMKEKLAFHATTKFEAIVLKQTKQELPKARVEMVRGNG